MADKKISALTGAATPLAGTEVLPIVQSGSTVKVAVSDLTAGRSVSAASLALTSSPLPATSGGTGQSSAFTSNGVPYATSTTALAINGNLTFNGSVFQVANSGYAARSIKLLPNTSDPAYYTTITDNISTDMTIEKVIFGKATTSLVFYDGNVTNSNGNFVLGTAAKGVNFTANTPAAGMTSQLLNWYEEGTWTPTQGSGLTVTGAFTSNGTYTRIGRLVTVRGKVDGATSVSCTSGGQICAGLPFAPANDTAGSWFNATLANGGVVDAAAAGIYAVGAIGATASIFFAVSYQV